jgi:hypothetical protein
MNYLNNPKLQKFVQNKVEKKVNNAIRKATGVDILHTANRAGLKIPGHIDPNNPTKTTSSERLVMTIDDFKKLRDRLATTPIGGVVCLVHALLNWGNPATRHVGEQMLVLATAEEMLVPGSTYKAYGLSQEIVAMLSQASPRNPIATISSLVAGTKSNAGYTFNPEKVAVVQDLSYGEVKPINGVANIRIKSSGDVSSRGVTVSINAKGIWKARDFHELLRDVHAPPVCATAVDDL